MTGSRLCRNKIMASYESNGPYNHFVGEFNYFVGRGHIPIVGVGDKPVEGWANIYSDITPGRGRSAPHGWVDLLIRSSSIMSDSCIPGGPKSEQRIQFSGTAILRALEDQTYAQEHGPVPVEGHAYPSGHDWGRMMAHAALLSEGVMLTAPPPSAPHVEWADQ